MRFFWIVTALSTGLAALITLITMLTSKSAPQEAAGYAWACALAVIPYVFTRALEALGAPEERKRDLNRLVKAIERGPDTAPTP